MIILGPARIGLQVYGDPLAYMDADQAKFVTEREYFGDFGYGECFNSQSSEVQVIFRVRD